MGRNDNPGSYRKQAITLENATTYAQPLQRAWEKSLVLLVATGQNVSIGAVARAPWLAVIVPLVVGVALITCWTRKHRKCPKE